MPHTFGAGLIWPRSNEFNLFFLSNMKFLFWLSFFSNNFLRFSLFHSYFSKPLIAFYWVFIELIQLRQITANFPQYYFSMLLPTYLLVFNFLFNLMMSQFGHLFTCNTGFFLLHSHTDLNLFCYVFTYFLNLLCCIDCFLQSIFILWVLGLCLIAFRLVLRSLTVFHCSTEFLDEIEFDSILFFSFFWGGVFRKGCCRPAWRVEIVGSCAIQRSVSKENTSSSTNSSLWIACFSFTDFTTVHYRVFFWLFFCLFFFVYPVSPGGRDIEKVKRHPFVFPSTMTRSVSMTKD